MSSLLGTYPPGLIEAVLDDVGVALAIVDRSGNLVLANGALRRIFGKETKRIGITQPLSVLEQAGPVQGGRQP